MNKQTILAFVLALGTAHAQTWQKVATEGTSASTAPTVAIKAGQSYRFGAGTSWCASVTPPVDTKISVWWAAMGCKDPAPGVLKELDVLVPPIVIPPAQPTITLPPLVAKTWTCTGTLTYSLMTDGTFSLGNTGALTCKETL